MATEAPLLAISDLFVSFPTQRGIVHALNGVSLEVRPGKLVGMIGETGCGKSVTARSILRILRSPGRIDSGSIQFRGQELLELSETELATVRGAQIGFIPQDPIAALDPILRIEDQFAMVLKAHRQLSKKACRALSEEALKRAGIAGTERVLRGYAHQLSGGMAQRVVIAIATILDPMLVIADEPTTGLDVTIQRQILDLIAERFRSENRTLLLVTHDLGVVAEYCDEVFVMYAGKVVESGPVRRIFSSPAHPYTKLLIESVELTRLDRAGEERPTGVLDLVDYAKGCPYAQRCPLVMDRCLAEPPAIRAIGIEHGASCHRAEEVIGSAAARS
jgi:oligopeptide/dipeptide ABC transporter ATP-binding protein